MSLPKTPILIALLRLILRLYEERRLISFLQTDLSVLLSLYRTKKNKHFSDGTLVLYSDNL